MFSSTRNHKPLREIWLDLDATDDSVHDYQEGRFLHGYYGYYCYLPLYIFLRGAPVVWAVDFLEPECRRR